MKSLVRLGDQAALANFASEDKALRFAAAVRAANESWLVDVVSAYQSVAVFYDLARVGFAEVSEQLRRVRSAPDRAGNAPGRVRQIPCCYEMESDLARVAQFTRLTPAEVIGRHSALEYTVYAIGFCPGFPYLGYLPPELSGVPRLDSPRLRVEAGSVGLTGRQTGIYTEPRPGGWNLIGRTPLELVNVADGYFPLRAGDRVRFIPISTNEFAQLKGKRLEGEG